MNSYEKGLKYEKAVFSRFKKLLEDDKLLVHSKNSKIRFKPQYYSQKRDAHITFDFSIEVTLDGKDNYSFIYLVECKNYKDKVPIDDLEEFESKLSQVAPHNCKGIICTPVGFQGSCLDFARNNGIALIRMGESSEIIWDTNRISMSGDGISSSEIINKLENTILNNDINISNDFFGAIYCHCGYYSIIEFLKDLLKLEYKDASIDRNNFNIPVIEKAVIREKVKNEIISTTNKFDENNYKKIFYEYIENLKNRIEIINNCDLGINRYNMVIIGKYKNGVIYCVDEGHNNYSRYCFTLAHEIGHMILHSNQDWYKKFNNQYTDVNISDFRKLRIQDEIKKIEKQANFFAAEMLVPDALLKNVMIKIIEDLNIVNKGYGYIYLDGQQVNNRLLNNVINRLKSYFPASKTVLRYKLESLGYLNVSGRAKNILNRMMKEWD